MSHGVAEVERLDLSNLNPIYERELLKGDKVTYRPRHPPALSDEAG